MAAAVRDYVLLIHLSGGLGSIGSDLEDYNDTIGIDCAEIEPSAPLTKASRSAETAINQVRELSNKIWRCELLSSALFDVDLKRRLLIHLHIIHEEIGQADGPAECDLIDGHEDEAIAICRDAFTRAYDQSGREIKRLAAECSTQSTLLFPRGCSMDDVLSAFRFDPFRDKNLATISTRELSELLGNLPGAEPAKPTSDVAHSTDFRSVRWFGTLYSFTTNQAPVVRLLFENWEAGTPDVGDETLLLAVDPEAPPARLSTLFRDNPAWGTMIVAGGSKGTHRISEPAEQNP